MIYENTGRKELFMLKRVLILLSALSMLLIVGCSKAPEAEMQSAETAFQGLTTAEADQYAPEAYRTAMDTLQAAQEAKAEQDGKFALFRKYGKSKALFISAQQLATNAASEAAAAKERTRVEVEGMLAQMTTSIDATTTALAKAPKGKGSAADIELMKSELAAVNTSFADAQTNYNEGKYLVAKTKLEVIGQQLQKIMSDIEAAKAKKAGR
jgi:hypothetical protein